MRSVRLGHTINAEMVRKFIFSRPSHFFGQLQCTPFTDLLPSMETPPEPTVVQLLEILILNDGLVSTDVPPGLWTGLKDCFAAGLIHSREIDDGAAVYYLVSELHRWYCQRLLVPYTPQRALPHLNPISLAVDVIRQFRSTHLANLLQNTWARKTPSPPNAYQMEFYRSLYTLAGGRMAASPELMAKTGPGRGTMDFLLPDRKWGFELVRDQNRLPELVAGFLPTDEDRYLFEDWTITDYVILDFTTTKPSEAHPGKNLGEFISGG